MLAAAAILVKAVAIALLLRIAWTDFETQRIKNNDVLALSALGVAGLGLAASSSGSWFSLTIGLIAGAVLFIAMLPLWLLRKIGAGDVKLLAVAPLISGGDYLFAFARHEAAQEGRIKEGEIALLVAFGAGLTWGATLVRW